MRRPPTPEVPSRKIIRRQSVGSFATPSIDPRRHLADPLAMAVECDHKGGLAFRRRGIEAAQGIFLDEERPFEGAVIARKAHTVPCRIIAPAEIGKFDWHCASYRVRTVKARHIMEVRLLS